MKGCERTCQCAAQLDRIEAMLSQLLPKPEPSAQRLVQAIYDAEPRWFLAGELWRMAESERVSAEVDGLEEPELSQALAEHGIRSAHSLSRWIAVRSWAFERGDEERGGVQWKVRGFDGE